VVSKLKLEVVTVFVLMKWTIIHIIDGVPYSNESIGSANTSTALPSQSPLNSIIQWYRKYRSIKRCRCDCNLRPRGSKWCVNYLKKGNQVYKHFSNCLNSRWYSDKFVDWWIRSSISMRKQAFINDGIPLGYWLWCKWSGIKLDIPIGKRNY
jgi:hypothetical protein